MKRCSKCGEEKRVAEFYKDQTNKDGFHGWCKKCNSKCQKQFRIDHKREIAAGKRFKKYGKTEEELNQLFLGQGEKCAICQSSSGGSRNRWSVDHDHNNGNVRGIICNRCNLMLGLSKDNPIILQAASNYLLVSR